MNKNHYDKVKKFEFGNWKNFILKGENFELGKWDLG